MCICSIIYCKTVPLPQYGSFISVSLSDAWMNCELHGRLMNKQTVFTFMFMTSFFVLILENKYCTYNVMYLYIYECMTGWMEDLRT